MNRRAFERVPASLAVKVPHQGGYSFAIVTDISENGMCIRSGQCVSCDREVKVLFPMGSSNLEVPVKVVRSVSTLDFYDTMGVKVERPTKKYIKIIRNIEAITLH